ncbi:MAG: polysaccharide lyase [Paracoccaceae bacterium]|nr:polysaccharide lyase [Paracoccaceae bacterium]
MRSLLIGFALAFSVAMPALAKDIDGIRVEHANRKNKMMTVSAPQYPTRDGNTALAFQVKDGQCAGNRTYDDCKGGRERAEVKDRGRVKTDQETWYAFSLFVPNNTPSIDPANTGLVQWQDTKGSGEITLGLNLFKEGIELIQDDPTTQQTDDMVPPRPMVMKIIVPPSRVRGRWHDFRVQAVWSTKSSGLIRVWLNDRLVHEHRGRNLNRNVAPSFKFGLYRSGLKRLRSAGKPVPTQLVFYDAVKRGRSQDEVTVR